MAHHMYLSSTVAVLVGALCAFLYSLYIQNLTSKDKIIGEYLSDLDQIERLATTYWLGASYDQRDFRHHAAVGHELRAKMDATITYHDVSKSILGNYFEQYEALDTELFMVATGGNFQTQEFEICPETYGEVIRVIDKIRVLLRKKRTAIFWTR